jgi:hypothetical protein
VDELINVFGPLQWRALWILCLWAFCVQAGWTMLPVFDNPMLAATAPALFTSARLARASSAFFGAWALGSLVFAVAADRFGWTRAVASLRLTPLFWYRTSR